MKSKKITAVILALCMVVALSACGGNPATTPNESANTPNTADVPPNDATVLKLDILRQITMKDIMKCVW